MQIKLFQRLTLFATALALCVVVLGAYTRLSNAGLGCPDWPGCYNQLTVPQVEQNLEQAQQDFPQRSFESGKAWKEMVHRYFAGTLGLIIFFIAVLAWQRRHESGQAVKLPLFLVLLVIFQALLGMWTVTLLLKPVVVMGHLLGGLATMTLLWWLTLRSNHYFKSAQDNAVKSLRPWVITGLIILVCQIALGGWTSANYAALACPDFPTCQTRWWPPMDFREAFILWRGLGIDYEGGVLGNDARVAIHVAHRIGAVVTLLYLGSLALYTVLARGMESMRRAGFVVLLVLITQISLGIANVVLSLPLPVAVAHNSVAALLLLSLVAMLHKLVPNPDTVKA